jgi:adenylyltransferase/sulfurtransferase
MSVENGGVKSNFDIKSIISTKMDAANESAKALRKKIADAEAQLADLKNQLIKVENDIALGQARLLQDESFLVTHESDIDNEHGAENITTSEINENNQNGTKWPLSPEEYKRYGRQMIVPNIGLQGM